jgi:hypothetical protein
MTWDITDNDLQHNDYHPDTIDTSWELTPITCQQDLLYRNHRQNRPDIEQLTPNFALVFVTNTL